MTLMRQANFIFRLKISCFLLFKCKKFRVRAWKSLVYCFRAFFNQKSVILQLQIDLPQYFNRSYFLPLFFFPLITSNFFTVLYMSESELVPTRARPIVESFSCSYIYSSCLINLPHFYIHHVRIREAAKQVFKFNPMTAVTSGLDADKFRNNSIGMWISAKCLIGK